MNLEEKEKQLKEHTKLPFPSMEDLDLWAEFVMLDADIVGELQSIIGKGSDHFQHLDSYKKELEEIRTEAKQKGFKEIIEYLNSLEELLKL